MTIPKIEDIVAPHLRAFRERAEAKRGGSIHSVELWFNSKNDGAPITAMVILRDSPRVTELGWAATVEEAIAKALGDIKPLPNAELILGSPL